MRVIAEPRQETMDVPDSEALIKEARQRQRRRLLFVVIVVLVAMANERRTYRRGSARRTWLGVGSSIGSSARIDRPESCMQHSVEVGF